MSGKNISLWFSILAIIGMFCSIIWVSLIRIGEDHTIPKDGVGWSKERFAGHVYVVGADGPRAYSAIHDPDCPCFTNNNR